MPTTKKYSTKSLPICLMLYKGGHHSNGKKKKQFGYSRNHHYHSQASLVSVSLSGFTMPSMLNKKKG